MIRKKHILIYPQAGDGYIDVSFRDTVSGDQLGPRISIRVGSKGCSNSLIWLNSKGGYDSYAFLSINDEGLSVDKEDSVIHASDYSFTRKESRAVESEIEGLVFSEYIDEKELLWLYELIESPEVYLIRHEDNAIIYQPVIITTDKIARRTRDLFQLEIGYMVADKRHLHNGYTARSQGIIATLPTGGSINWGSTWN